MPSASSHNSPTFISYMERTRLYYRAQGFDRDYVWAKHESTPFTPLKKSLKDCTVTLITTAVAHPEIPKPVRKAESIPFTDTPDNFLTDELSWDKETTHTKDRECYFPIKALKSLESEQTIGRIAPRFHFVPTQYSHRVTVSEDAPAIAAACIEDKVDIAILVPI